MGRGFFLVAEERERGERVSLLKKKNEKNKGRKEREKGRENYERSVM